MNTLHLFLILCLSAYVSASMMEGDSSRGPVLGEAEEADPNSRSPEAQAFRKAVQEDDLEAANKILSYSQYWIIEYGVKHLVNLKNSNFILKLLKGKSYISEILEEFLFCACLQLVKSVLADAEISQFALKQIASSKGMACVPDKYAHILSMITDVKDQKKAVKKAVNGLCYSHMMGSLERFFLIFYDHTFSNPKLKEVAMSQAFQTSVEKFVRDKTWIKPLSDQPAISAKIYSSALYSLHDYKLKDSELFDWLLERADSGDLDFVMKHCDFQRMNEHFKQSVEGAKKAVDGAYRRHGMSRRKSAFVIDAALGEGFLTVLTQIVVDYMHW